MRREAELVADIARHGRLVLDLTADLDEPGFVARFGDGINPFAAAISFALIAIGEASRQLLGRAGAANGPEPAAIVTAHPESTGAGGSGCATS